MGNFKRYAFFVLLIILSISIFMNVRSCSKDSKYDDLEKINKKIQRDIDSIGLVNNKLSSDYNSKQDSINKIKLIIINLNNELEKSLKETIIYKDKVKNLENEKKDTENKIDNLIKNPINRSDLEMIKSLKNKLK
jgi:hypothetical protein